MRGTATLGDVTPGQVVWVYKKAKGSKPLSIVPSWLLLYLVPASRFLSIASTLTLLDDEIQTLTFLVPCPAHAAFGYGLCHR